VATGAAVVVVGGTVVVVVLVEVVVLVVEDVDVLVLVVVVTTVVVVLVLASSGMREPPAITRANPPASAAPEAPRLVRRAQPTPPFHKPQAATPMSTKPRRPRIPPKVSTGQTLGPPPHMVRRRHRGTAGQAMQGVTDGICGRATRYVSS
jgi:hypothetical protein